MIRLENEEFENMTGEKMPKIFPQSVAGQSMRWSKFKNDDPRRIFDVMSQRVFPAIKSMKYGRLPDFSDSGELIEIADDTQRNAIEERFMKNIIMAVQQEQRREKERREKIFELKLRGIID